MSDMFTLTDIEAEIIANKIIDSVFSPAISYKITVFLCGGAMSKKDTIRHKLSEEFKGYFQFDLIFPEDLFDELLYSSKSRDLLFMETLLADSVDVVVIIPESPGSYAELGAFSNDDRLRKKLLCLIDEQHKKKKSFINQGPVRIVKKANKNGVLYFNSNQIEAEFTKKIVPAVKRFKKNSEKQNRKPTLMQLENFVLPCIHLLEPVSKEVLIKLVDKVIEKDNIAFSMTTSVLSVLIKKRLIQLSNDGYKLTKLGKKEFFNYSNFGSRIKNVDERVVADNLRLEIFNLKYRGKKMVG